MAGLVEEMAMCVLSIVLQSGRSFLSIAKKEMLLRMNHSAGRMNDVVIALG